MPRLATYDVRDLVRVLGHDASNRDGLGNIKIFSNGDVEVIGDLDVAGEASADFFSAANGFKIGGVSALSFVGGYARLEDPDGLSRLAFGTTAAGDFRNVYTAPSHAFYNTDGSVLFGVLGSFSSHGAGLYSDPSTPLITNLGYITIWTGDPQPAIQIGNAGDPSNYYHANNHNFYDYAGGGFLMTEIGTGGVTIHQTTSSTNSTTGALKVAGGVGIAGNLNVGGGFGVLGAVGFYTNPEILFNGPGAGVWYGSVTTGAQRYFLGTDAGAADTFRLYSADLTTNIITANSSGVSFGIPIVGYGYIRTVDTTDSTGTTTGALRVSGGAGIAGDVNIGGNVMAGGAAPIVLDGGTSSFQAQNTGLPWALSSIVYGNNSNSPGIGFAKTRGANPTTHGAVLNSDPLFAFYVYPSDGGNFIPTGAFGFSVEASGAIGGNNVPTKFGVSTGVNNYGIERFTIGSDGVVSVLSTASSTTTTSGALKVAGGVGIVENLHVGGTIVATGGRSSGGVLRLAGGDDGTGYDYPTITFGYNNGDHYRHWIHTRHNTSPDTSNAFDFYTCDGTEFGTFPTNGVLGLTIANGRIRMPAAHVGDYYPTDPWVGDLPTFLTVSPGDGSGSAFYVSNYYDGGEHVLGHVTNFSASGYGEGIYANYARGTSASPAAVGLNDELGYLGFNGYDGSGWKGVWIAGIVDGAVSAGSVPISINFYTGAATGVRRLQISSAGIVFVLNTDAASSSTTGAFRVAGGMSAQGNIHSGGNINSDSSIIATNVVEAGASNTTGFWIGGSQFIYYDSGYVEFRSIADAGRLGLEFGPAADPGNYYHGDYHYFTDRDSVVPWATLDNAGFDLQSGSYLVASTKVVGARDTGWTAMTGAPNKAATYDTSTVTLAQLAGRVAQLQASLATHGLIGA